MSIILPAPRDPELLGEEVEVRLEVEDEDKARQVEAEPQLDRQLREGEALGRRRRQQLAELGEVNQPKGLGEEAEVSQIANFSTSTVGDFQHQVFSRNRKLPIGQNSCYSWPSSEIAILISVTKSHVFTFSLNQFTYTIF